MAVVTGDRVNIFIIRSIPRLVISRNPLSTIIMSSVISDYVSITASTDIQHKGSSNLAFEFQREKPCLNMC